MRFDLSSQNHFKIINFYLGFGFFSAQRFHSKNKTGQKHFCALTGLICLTFKII